jgi:hypothetical protein
VKSEQELSKQKALEAALIEQHIWRGCLLFRLMITELVSITQTKRTLLV